MSAIDLAMLAGGVRARIAAPHEARAPAADIAFGTRIAAFYPYQQSPIDPQPRAGSPSDPDQRAGGVPGPRAAQRRRFGRGES